MKKWLVMILISVLCIAGLAAASAEAPFAITETGQTELTLFKNTGILSRDNMYFSVLFNATGLDKSKPIYCTGVSAPFEIEYFEPEYYEINSEGYQSDDSGHDFYGCVLFSIRDDVFQTLDCKDYSISFTISHNGSTATLPCLIHVVDALPKTPTDLTGVENNYTILPDASVTITPVLNPSDWAGSYDARTRFFVNTSIGSGYAIALSDGTHALVTSEESEHLVLFKYDQTSMTVTGKVPGYYEMSANIYIPCTNVSYDLRIPLVVLNADGSSPINRPIIRYNIDSEIYGEEGITATYEITRYATKLNMPVSCYMDDMDNSGALNALVATEGAQAVTGQAVFTDKEGKEYKYQISGTIPYTGSGDTLYQLYSGDTIQMDNLPAGDYEGSISLNWYGSKMTVDILLHRGYNPSGDPEGITGIPGLTLMHIGEQLTLPMAVVPAGWKAPQPAQWFSSVSPMTDGDGTFIYYEDENWVISNGDTFTCQRTESSSGFTDIYTAKASGFYSGNICMVCADYQLSKDGYIVVLNEDGSIPDGGLPDYAIYSAATLIIPADTTRVDSEAFANTPDNAVVYFPGTVKEIAQNAFSGVSGLIVLGEQDSAAQRFAQQNGYVFVPVQHE